LTANGNASIDVNGGSLIANSIGPDVLDFNGTVSVEASNYAFTATNSSNVGSTSDLHSSTGGSPTIAYGQAPTADPLSSLAAPSGGTPQTYTGQATLNPGIYNSGISANGNTSITLTSGIYIINGSPGISLNGNATITGTSGVILYFNPGVNGTAVSINGNAILNLTPMSSGTYQGISIYVNRTATNPSIDLNGNTALNISGTIYAPSTNITVNGNAGTLGSELIVNKLTMNGNASFTIGNSGGGGGGTQFFELVE